MLMVGSPGSGKTMLAKRVPTILPTLGASESIETTRIYSALGRLRPGEPLMAARPFRSPHHTISDAGLVGGGSTPTPGEISLSHNGVLFWDELPEFNRRTLEVLRQPLEDGAVTISRAIQRERFAGTRTRYNAQMTTREIRKYCRLDEDCLEILRSSVNEHGLSARAHDKVLRVSRTIADLDGNPTIQPAHIQEAVNYRMLDRNLWT